MNVPIEREDEGEQEKEEESQEMRQDDLMRPGKRRRRTVASDQTVVQHQMRIQGSFDSKKGMCWGRFFAIRCAYT